MMDFIEQDETVGRFWHWLVGEKASLPHHPQAAVTLAAMTPTLAVCFRGFGGEPALGSHLRATPSQPPANLRQRVGSAAGDLPRARRLRDMS